MTSGRVFAVGALLLVGLTAVWWWAARPAAHHIVGPAVDFGGAPEAIVAVERDQASLDAVLERIDSDVPGHDDILLDEDAGVAFVPGMDGAIWRVSLEDGQGERFVDVPLMPSGMRFSPGDPDIIYFCASRLHGTTHSADERVGLYRLDVSSRTVTPVVIDVASTPAIPEQRRKVYPDDDPSAPTLDRASNAAASRPLEFCNDLDISKDGRRLYFTEPIAYEGASMGGGAVSEAITLGDNGRLWRHDLDTGATRLIADGFHFIDGILVENEPEGERESSVLVTNTPGFAISRYFLRGPRAGTAEEVWTSLPGMPDGMDRDAEGRIWVGLFRKRSGFLTWAHKNPWIKPLLLRLPLDLLPVPKQTGVLGLSPDGSIPIFYAMYEGPMITDAAVVIPGSEHLYVANFDREGRGLVRMPYPDVVSTAKFASRLGAPRPTNIHERPPEVSMSLLVVENHVVARRDNGEVLTWDLATGESTLLATTSTLFAGCASKGVALINDLDGSVQLMNLTDGHKVTVTEGAYDYGAWDGGCDRFALTGEDLNQIEIWDVEGPSKIATLETEEAVRNGLAMSPDGHFVVAAEGSYEKEAGHRTEVELFRIDDGTASRVAKLQDDELHLGMWTMVFSPDSETLFVGSQTGGRSGLLALATASGEALWRQEGFESYWVRAIAVSPDGATVATGDEKGKLKLWDSKTGELRSESHVGQVIQALDFETDGGRVATSLKDTTIVMVEVTDSKEQER